MAVVGRSMGTYGRREFLKGIGALAAAATIPTAALASDDALRPEHRTFILPDLHPAHDGLRVAQLSDLHVGPRTPLDRIRASIEQANGFEPDLVVLTGDYLCRDESGVGLMREQLAGLRAPTVAVLGNHDHWVDAQGASWALESLGYAVLRNQNTSLTLRGERFTVIGIDDLFTRHADPRKAFRGAARRSRIALAHGPKTADVLARLGKPLLCLSGHTHGGQINIPGLTPILLKAFVHEPYDRGPFQVGRVQLYVNRGVGNSALRLRVNSPPEVALMTLRAA